MTVLAFAVVIVPFAIILGRLLAAPGQPTSTCPTISPSSTCTPGGALHWKQQLGVFDHNGWNHPGPSYFYLLSLVYRVLGSGPRPCSSAPPCINALAAVGLRRRGAPPDARPARALWAAALDLRAGHPFWPRSDPAASPIRRVRSVGWSVPGTRWW